MNAVHGKKILLLSVLLFLISLVVPAFSYHGTQPTRDYCYGWLTLALGWFPAIFGLVGSPQGQFEYIGTISWLANPLLMTAWIGILIKSRLMSMFSGIAALCLSCLFFLTHNIPIPDNQSMTNVSVSIGYFLWISSMVCVLIAASRLDPLLTQKMRKMVM